MNMEELLKAADAIAVTDLPDDDQPLERLAKNYIKNFARDMAAALRAVTAERDEARLEQAIANNLARAELTRADTANRALEEARADSRRLDAMQEMYGSGVLSDDRGHWVVSDSGMQNVPLEDGPQDIATTFFIEAEKWRPSIREAIDAALSQPAAREDGQET